MWRWSIYLCDQAWCISSLNTRNLWRIWSKAQWARCLRQTFWVGGNRNGRNLWCSWYLSCDRRLRKTVLVTGNVQTREMLSRKITIFFTMTPRQIIPRPTQDRQGSWIKNQESGSRIHPVSFWGELVPENNSRQRFDFSGIRATISYFSILKIHLCLSIW